MLFEMYTHRHTTNEQCQSSLVGKKLSLNFLKKIKNMKKENNFYLMNGLKTLTKIQFAFIIHCTDLLLTKCAFKNAILPNDPNSYYAKPSLKPNAFHT